MTDSSDRGREVLWSTAGEQRGWKLWSVRRYNFIESAHRLRSLSKNHSCGRRLEEVRGGIRFHRVEMFLEKGQQLPDARQRKSRSDQT